ncbi:MAG: response regulator transcription factor [Rhodospirillales bacterium]|nr:response regulator transcription factor [Rhodospirillales bacterium]
MSQYLGMHGIIVDHSSTFDAAMERLATTQPHVVVLDQFLGTVDTLTQLAAVREKFPGALMFLTGNSDATDRVMGLEMGADDYASKNIPPREILARLRCLMRRPQLASPCLPEAETPTPAPARPLPGHWFLDTQRRELYRPDGERAHLTTAEFAMLQCLNANVGRPVSRDELSMTVLRRPYNPLDRSIDNIISRLRKKLSGYDQGGRLIMSVRGDGYVFVGFDAD